MHPPRLLGVDADLDHDASLGQAPVAGTRDFRIGINQRGHYARNPSADDRVGTGRRLAVMRARLERDIERRPARSGTGTAQRLGLGMGPPAGLSPAAADDHSVFHDDRPDGGVGPGAAEAAAAERERERHEAGVFRAIHGRRRSMRLAPNSFRATIYVIPTSATHNGSFNPDPRKRKARTHARRPRRLYRRRGAVGCIPCQGGRTTRTRADARLPPSV
jgi:hypothetical protein